MCLSDLLPSLFSGACHCSSIEFHVGFRFFYLECRAERAGFDGCGTGVRQESKKCILLIVLVYFRFR